MTVITEDYVSFETAKLLKENGFNEVCEMFYCKPHEGYLKNRKRDEWWNSDLREDMTCTCPSIQMAMKWLREQNKIISILHSYVTNKYRIIITQFNKLDIANLNNTLYISNDYDYFSYEEACEAAIKYCLENLI